jgi:hypothetical protein
MADENPTDCGEGHAAVPAAEDVKAERQVMTFLLNEYPNQLTIAEVSRALNDGAIRFDTEDAVERAIRELVGAGLLHCRDGFVLPTRAARYLALLEID